VIKKETKSFKKWFDILPDNVRYEVRVYIGRVLDGNFFNCKSVGGGVSELKINYQKGYRVYYTIARNNTILLLLIGGDKKSQQKDIVKAIEIKKFLKQKGEI
jgi:putative addiction module killer protein